MKTKQTNYPMGSVSHATMRPEDLIPAFTAELEYRLKNGPPVGRARKKAHRALLKEIAAGQREPDYYETDASTWDLDQLFDALGDYAGPYFYFGAHPGDGSDYGWWLSEDWDAEFVAVAPRAGLPRRPGYEPGDHAIKVDDLAEIPKGFRGEVALVNDHGNVTLYAKGARSLREIWSIV